MGAGDDVVRLAGRHGLVAAGPAAAPVADGDGAAQVDRDALGDSADIQRQAHRRHDVGCQPGPQVGRQPARAGQQIGGGLDHPLPCGAAGPDAPAGDTVQQGGGEVVENVGIDVAGDDRDDRRVAVIARRGRGTPGCLGRGRARQAAELVEAGVQHDLGGLAGPVRQPAGADQPPARLFQRIVGALTLGPAVFRAGLFAQGVQHRLQRRGATGSQVAVEFPGAAERGLQTQPPVIEAVIVAVGRGEAAAHLVGQGAQTGQVRTGRRGTQQDLIGVAAVLLGQQVAPFAQLPRPGGRDPPGGQRLANRRVVTKTPHPSHRTGRRARRDPGLPFQPGPRRTVPVILVPAAGAERRQHPRPRSGVHGFGPLQPPQALGLLGPGQGGRVRRRQPRQPRPRHRDRLGSGCRSGGRMAG